MNEITFGGNAELTLLARRVSTLEQSSGVNVDSDQTAVARIATLENSLSAIQTAITSLQATVAAQSTQIAAITVSFNALSTLVGKAQANNPLLFS